MKTAPPASGAGGSFTRTETVPNPSPRTRTVYSPGSVGSDGTSAISTLRAPLSLDPRTSVVPDDPTTVASSARPGGVPALNSPTTQNSGVGRPSLPRRQPATTSARSGMSRA